MTDGFVVQDTTADLGFLLNFLGCYFLLQSIPIACQFPPLLYFCYSWVNLISEVDSFQNAGQMFVFIHVKQSLSSCEVNLLIFLLKKDSIY